MSKVDDVRTAVERELARFEDPQLRDMVKALLASRSGRCADLTPKHWTS
jgi:hypothetical protein